MGKKKVKNQVHVLSPGHGHPRNRIEFVVLPLSLYDFKEA